MKKELESLIQNLKALQLKNEANLIEEFLKTASNISDWESVLKSINTPLPGDLDVALDFIKKGILEMQPLAEKLKDFSASDIKTALFLINNTPKDKIQSTAQLKSLWQGTKYIGKQTARVIPIVGFVFSFLIALKNFIYGVNAFATICNSNSKNIGLNWIDVLNPQKLKISVKNNKDNPNNLNTLVHLTKYSKKFFDEIISLFTNSLDFVKDVIFVFIDVGSFGWLTIGDISLSLFFMTIEYLIESKSLQNFDDIIFEISNIAEINIRNLSNMDTDFNSMDYSGFKTWFSNH